MKTGLKKSPSRRGAGPASSSRKAAARGTDREHSQATDSRQTRLIRDIDNSAAMTLQRQRLEQSFGQPMQRQEEEELQMMQSPIQRVEEDEELIQGRFESLQRQEEEEELQMMQVPAQRVEEDEELMQGKSESLQREQQPAKPANQTGMPDSLKAGIEALSGRDLSGVRVHYNSSRPQQFNALAYAQGNEIHLGSGQEKHLPHEAWHAVQQREGRVEPTAQIAGEKVNTDSSLEREADIMGEKALQYRKK